MTAASPLTDRPHARASAMVQKYRWPLLLGGGFLLGLTVIFPSIGLLEWVALIPALLVILTRVPDPAVRYRQLYGMGFAFFFSFYVVNFYWLLCLYPLDFAGMDKATAVFVVLLAWLGLSAFQAVGAALILPLMGWLTRRRVLSRLPLAHPFLFASLWTVWEWFQAHSGWAGVPWARLPLGQVQLLPILQSAAYLGSYFITFLLLAVNGVLAHALLYPHRRWVCLSVAVGLLFGDLAIGGCRWLTTPQDAGDPVRVAAIQGNISSHDDYALGAVAASKAVYGDLSRQAAAAGAEVILWPETALVLNLDTSESTRAFVSDLAVECGATILVGAFTSVPDSAKLYNSIVAVLPDGSFHDIVYNKQNPVPFGEFVPYRDLIMKLVPPLAEIAMLSEDIPAGEDSVVFDLEAGAFGSIICFDSIYEDNILRSVRNGAEVLCVSTNDSWFRDSRGVWMHEAQSQLRAIETGRYVVRAAITGVSGIITPRGEVTDELPPYETGYAMNDVYLRQEVTLYACTGNVFVMACLLFSLVWALLAVREKAATCRQRDKNVKTT